MPDEPDYYAQLRERADRFFEEVSGRHPGSFACRAGCSSCCERVLTLFPLEADRLEAAVRRLPDAVRAALGRRLEGSSPGCPLLLDGRCAAYDDRPLICRTHGAPVLVDGEVDVCPLNFVGEAVPRGSALDLERFNEVLVAVNVYHSRRQGVDPAARRSLTRIVASALFASPAGDGGPAQAVEEDP